MNARLSLSFRVPFKAADGVKAEDALRDKLLNIEGVAIDASVNANKWQVPESDLQFVADGLVGAQLRVDHSESVLGIVGKVTESSRVGDLVNFKGEVSEPTLIQKIQRGYVDSVSIQVDSDDVECSKCHKATRRDGLLVHLCPGAWEVIHKPVVRELSIVATPAYVDTKFQQGGFASAMNMSQKTLKAQLFTQVVQSFTPVQREQLLLKIDQVKLQLREAMAVKKKQAQLQAMMRIAEDIEKDLKSINEASKSSRKTERSLLSFVDDALGVLLNGTPNGRDYLLNPLALSTLQGQRRKEGYAS